MTPIEIGLIVAGIVLAFAGAALFKYTVTLIGFLSGAAGGYAIASYLALDPLILAGAALVAGLAGVFLAFTLITTVATIPGFLLGSYVAGTAVGLSGSNLGLEPIGITIFGGILGAAAAGLLFKKVLPILMAFVGAALVTQAWTVEAFSQAASSLDPSPVLFDPTPAFIAVVAVGTLSQYGLVKLGWAKKLTVPLALLWARIRGSGEPVDDSTEADTSGEQGASPR
ncbi:hypothetical protein [Natranaeroarchaeum aerophilus]|uniref:Phosphate ABC transporter permease n=1 Tax=Natranaeroarchaeum aerophilus TaxID=2917711 RepID=A0AAE3K683_9EURY|nr:hypothetical protein [Natranaeroarchaeum aerophilus]MCL9812549.1 hypothetical protein [Natranaeroarchaeum aerophilus]